MAQVIRDVMTSDPITIESSETLAELARRMREGDTGAIVVLQDGSVSGIVTDRDIVVRAIADGRDVSSTTVGDVCSADLESVGPDASVDQVVQTMRSRAIRRLPVVEHGHAVGIVSIGDLALERDQNSALADISAAPGNT